jgi:4-diphosphocytidyl-2C-methyl-D-erythritol kinase
MDLDDVTKAIYQTALKVTESAIEYIEYIEAIDAKAHGLAVQVDSFVHEKLEALKARAANLREKLGIMSSSGAPTFSAAAMANAEEFVQSLGPHGS